MPLTSWKDSTAGTLAYVPIRNPDWIPLPPIDLPPLNDKRPESAEGGQVERLTSIRDAYTLASTPDPGSETDKLMINNFLTTLAEIAFAFASLNLRDEQERGD